MSSAPVVAALGRAGTDFFGAGVRLGELRTNNDLTEVSVQVGGEAAISAVTAAALGCEVRFAGKLADDFLGRFILEGLRSANVDTTLVALGAGRLSPFSFTAVDRDPGRRHRFATPGDVAPLGPDEVDFDALLEGAVALLLDGTQPRAQAAAAEAASRRAVPVVLDAGELREGTGELIALADVLLSSERLASEIAPRGELQDSLIELQQLGPRSVVITMGDTGSMGLHDDQLVQQPAHPIPRVTDTSGAGSVYHGAFAAALAHGDPFARCMEIASITAGMCCADIGPIAGLPSRDDVLARLDG